MIASKNGEQVIGEAVRSAIAATGMGNVYVVSDGSTDATATCAWMAGAEVLELDTNVGKPAALRRLMTEYRLVTRYEAIAVLDDDTIVAPDFIEKVMAEMKPGVGIVVGRTVTRWEDENRWNVWLGSRCYSYWRYQATLRRGQSTLNAMNCISGSNSVFRSRLLDQVVVEETPYAVDDTYWTLETKRRALGRIVYCPDAHAMVCDPLTLGDWYRQSVRWNWGMFQGVWGHRVGRRFAWFDFTYALLILDWFLYVVLAPAVLTLLLLQRSLDLVWFPADPFWFAGIYFLGVLVWVVAASAATRKWRMVLMSPAFIVIDWIYRITFVHALIKTIRQPRVSSCRWDPPARY